MEHIIQFGVTIDDQAIENKIIDMAAKEVLKPIKTKLESGIFMGWNNRELSYEAQDIVKDFLKEHKQDIIDKAAEYLADKLLRTKAVKEKVGEIL